MREDNYVLVYWPNRGQKCWQVDIDSANPSRGDTAKWFEKREDAENFIKGRVAARLRQKVLDEHRTVAVYTLDGKICER